MLKPETPTVLAHGDVITFGKSVGRDSHIVHPVVVRVGLLYDTQVEDASSSSAFKLPSLSELTKVPATVGAGSLEPSKHVSKPNSGRYGVYVPSSPESDASSSRSGRDSDIEELDGPPASQHTTSRVVANSKFGRALHALSQLIPPVHKPPVIHITSRSPSSPCHPRSPSPLYDPYSPCFSPADPFIPFEDFVAIPLLGDSASPSLTNIGFDAYSNDIFEEHSRSSSTSPMDLSSPSPASSTPQVNGSRRVSRSASPVVGEAEGKDEVDVVIEKAPAQDSDDESDAEASDCDRSSRNSTPIAQDLNQEADAEALDCDCGPTSPAVQGIDHEADSEASDWGCGPTSIAQVTDHETVAEGPGCDRGAINSTPIGVILPKFKFPPTPPSQAPDRVVQPENVGHKLPEAAPTSGLTQSDLKALEEKLNDGIARLQSSLADVQVHHITCEGHMHFLISHSSCRAKYPNCKFIDASIRLGSTRMYTPLQRS
jgi:hypothetical protein